MALMRRIAILLWAAAASLLIHAIIGNSNVLSSLFGVEHVARVAYISFVVFTVLFALIFWLAFKRCKSVIIIVFAFLPPIFIFWFILFR